MFLSKEYHISLSEIRKLEYFRYEWLLEEANNDVKEQQKRQKEEEMQRNKSENAYKPPKMPSMPTFKMPKF